MPANTDLILQAGDLGGEMQNRVRQLRAADRAENVENLRLDEAEAKAGMRERLRSIAPQLLGSGGELDYGALSKFQAQEGDIEGMQQTAKTRASLGVAQARQQTAEIAGRTAQLKLASNQLNSANQMISQATDEQSYQQILARAQQDPMFQGTDFSMYPEHFDNVALNAIQMKLLKVKDRVDLEMKKEARKIQGEQFQQRESRQAGQFQQSQAGMFARANAANASRMQAAGIMAGSGSIQPLSEEERQTLNIGPDAPLYKTRKGELKELPGASAAFKVEDQVQGMDTALQSVDALESHLKKHGSIRGTGMGGGISHPEVLGERESIQSQALFSVGIPQVSGALQAHEQAQLEKQIQTAIVDWDNPAAAIGGKERALAALNEVKKTLLNKRQLVLGKAQSLRGQTAPQPDPSAPSATAPQPDVVDFNDL